MAQNNSVFVWKTSNYSCGKSNLRNDINQVTNLKSLGFTRKRIASLLGVFPEVVLCDIDFQPSELMTAFSFAIVKAVKVVICRRWISGFVEFPQQETKIKQNLPLIEGCFLPQTFAIHRCRCIKPQSMWKNT